jgi:hypothetical protein
MKQRSIILLAVLMIMTLAAWSLAAEEKEGKSEENGEVSSAEIATILEEINQKMDKITREPKMDKEPAPDEGFGGGSYWPVRIFFGMDKMNSYLVSLGTYPKFPMVSIPMMDGGGGTWRISFNKNFQIGVNYWAGGFSSLGQQNHTTTAGYTPVTEDEDSDGYDDYYTYANYSLFYWSFLGMGKLPVTERINWVFGAQTGLGRESFGISRNERTITDTLGVTNDDVDWSRMLFIPGAWTGVQFEVGNMNIFKLGLDVGFDYPIPMGVWEPGAGTHVQESSPPADFNGMNLWTGINMQFHF